MTNIHYLDSFKAEPIVDEKITDELIESLYDFAPRNVFYWTLKFAKLKFNQRHRNNEQGWFDLLHVYVGLPDWIITEAQIEAEKAAHLKVPFGLINDISEISDNDFTISVPIQLTNSDTGEAYNSLYHAKAKYFALRCYEIESDIINKNGDFEDMEDQFDTLIEHELDNVWRKKQVIVQILKDDDFQNERIETLYTCLNTCMGLAEGNKELIEAFTDIQDAGEIGPEEARKIYSNLTIEEFFEWGSDHFGLDDYYTDADTLVDNVKYHMECDERMLIVNEPYKFITQIIARSFKIAEHN
jgi:hypothetical protein